MRLEFRYKENLNPLQLSLLSYTSILFEYHRLLLGTGTLVSRHLRIFFLFTHISGLSFQTLTVLSVFIMFGLFKIGLLISALAANVLATPIIAERGDNDRGRGGTRGNHHGGPGWPGRPPKGCENGPKSRDCWSRGFDINTNYYKSWPNTGRTREVRQDLIHVSAGS